MRRCLHYIMPGSSVLQLTEYTGSDCTGSVAVITTAQYYTSCLLLAQDASSDHAESWKTSIYTSTSSSSSGSTWLSQGAVGGIVIACLGK